jgi:hypothetical protein
MYESDDENQSLLNEEKENEIFPKEKTEINIILLGTGKKKKQF